MRPQENKSYCKILLAVTVVVAAGALYPDGWSVQRSGNASPARPAPAAGGAPAVSLAASPAQDAYLPALEQLLAHQPVDEAKLGECLAQRRAWLKGLMASAPEQAAAARLPWAVRSRVPAGLSALLEAPVDARGTVAVHWSYNPGSGAGGSAHRVVAESGEQVWRAYLPASRQAALMEAGELKIALHGIALDGELALSDSFVRVMEPGEPLPEGGLRGGACPVSALPVTAPLPAGEPAPADVVVADVGGTAEAFCEPQHVDERDREIALADGWSGGGQPLTGDIWAKSRALGQIRLLYFPITYADQNVSPQALPDLRWQADQAAATFQKASYGRLTLLPTIAPPVVLPRTEAFYKFHLGDDAGRVAEMRDAIEVVRQMGYDPESFDTIALRRNGGAQGAPKGWGGGARIWINETAGSVAAQAETLTHELGHTFGLGHARYWPGSGFDPLGPTTDDMEYGNIFDVLGNGPVDDGQFNVRAKHKIGWITGETLHDVPPGGSGVYRVHAHDMGRADTRHRVALRVVKDGSRTYYFDFRQAYSGRSGTFEGMNRALGAVVHWREPGGNSQLLDTTPDSMADLNSRGDAGIVVGRTFHDAGAELFVTPIAWNPPVNGAPASLDVSVQQGKFPGNAAPVITQPATLTPLFYGPEGWETTVTAAATDADDPALSWHWQADARIPAPTGGSSCRIVLGESRGPLNILYTVSDRRGGLVRGSLRTMDSDGAAVTAVSGRVLAPGGAPLPDVTVIIEDTKKTAITDATGTYRVHFTGTAPVTVRLRKLGWSIPNATISPAPAAQAVPVVTHNAAALPHVALEISGHGTAGGAITLRRVWPDGTPDARPGQPRAHVKVSRIISSGTVKSTAPAILAIPAGQTSAQWPLTSFIQTPAEATRFTLEVQNEHLPAEWDTCIFGAASVTADYVPAGITAPHVALAAAGPVEEGSGGVLTFLLTRSLPAAGSLTVALGLAPAPSGVDASTVASSQDATLLDKQITFPPGVIRMPVRVAIHDDGLSEAPETVYVRIEPPSAPLPAGSYVFDAMAVSEGQIVDDDVQEIAVEVRRAEMTEPAPGSGSIAEPGLVVFRRTGRVAEALTVPYSVAGDATHGVDFAALPGTVTFAPGQVEAVIAIHPVGDGVAETASPGSPGERFIIAPAQRNHRCRFQANAVASLWIRDAAADRPALSMEVTEHAIEGQSGEIIIRSSTPWPAPLTLSLDVITGELAHSPWAEAAASDANVPATLSFGAGRTEQRFAIPAVADGIAEDMETLRLRLRPQPGGTFVVHPGLETADLWIRDAGKPVVFIDSSRHAATEPSATQGARNEPFFISRKFFPAQAVNAGVQMIAAESSAMIADVQNPGPTPVSLPDGDATKVIDFRALADTDAEPEEFARFELVVQPATEARGMRWATGRIEPNGVMPAGLPTLAFAQPQTTVSEPAFGQTQVLSLPLISTGPPLPAGTRVRLVVRVGGLGEPDADNENQVNLYEPAATGSGMDYRLRGHDRVLHFTAGQTLPAVTLTLTGDGVPESTGCLPLRLIDAQRLGPAAGQAPVIVNSTRHDVLITEQQAAPRDWDRWRTAHGIPAAMPDGDHDGDGVSNRWEYAFGTSPTAANAGPGFEASPLADGRWQISWPVPAVADARLSLRCSEDLSQWMPVEIIDSTSVAAGRLEVIVPLPAAPPRLFFQLVESGF